MSGSPSRQLRVVTPAVIALVVLAGAACSKSSGGGDTFGETKDDSIAKLVPSDMASKGSLTVASDASYAPMESFATDNKTVIGADADLGHAMGAVLGVTFDMTEATFDGIIPGIQAGKYDLGMSSFFDTKEREKTVDMVDYFQAGSAVMTASTDTATYTSLDQFCGKTVAAESGTTELDDAQAASKTCQTENKPAITVSSFGDQNGVNLAVISGRAAAGLGDTEVVQYQVKVTGGKVRFAGNYAASVLYGIAVPRPAGAAPGTGPLTKAIQQAMQKLIDDGTYAKILQKYGIQSGALKTATVNGATS